MRTKLAILWRHDIHVEIHCLTIRKVYDKEKCHTLSPFLSYWPYCSHFPSPFPCFFPRPPPPPALRRRRHGNRGGGETGNRPRPEETNMLLLACQNRKPKPCFCRTYNREKEKRSFMVTNTPTCKKRKGLPSIQGSLVGHTNRSLSFFSWPQLSERPRFVETKRKLALDKKKLQQSKLSPK